jgi:hypothetical protein
MKHKILSLIGAIIFGAVMATLIVLLVSEPAQADPVTYDALVFGKSFHFGDRAACEPCNDYNPGLGLEAHKGPWLVGALDYYDSYRHNAKTGYVGYEYRLPITSDLYVGATVRAGYMGGSGFHNWAALPSVEVGYKAVALEATFIPAIRSNQTNVLALWARYSF